MNTLTSHEPFLLDWCQFLYYDLHFHSDYHPNLLTTVKQISNLIPGLFKLAR